MRARGITLIELLIVLGIIAIIMSVGAVNFFGFKQKNDLDLAANQIVSVLRNAQERSRSQEDGSDWGVRFGNPISGGDFFSLFKGNVFSDAGVVSRINISPTVIFIDPAENSSKDVVFGKITGLPNASTTIIIALRSDSSKTKTITVNSNGRIHLQ